MAFVLFASVLPSGGEVQLFLCSSLPQNGGCWGSEIRTEEVDPLL